MDCDADVGSVHREASHFVCQGVLVSIARAVEEDHPFPLPFADQRVVHAHHGCDSDPGTQQYLRSTRARGHSEIAGRGSSRQAISRSEFIVEESGRQTEFFSFYADSIVLAARAVGKGTAAKHGFIATGDVELYGQVLSCEEELEGHAIDRFENERSDIHTLFDFCGGAELLGLNPSTPTSRMKKLEVERPV